MICRIDYPVCHIGARDNKVVACKLLLHAVDWNGVQMSINRLESVRLFPYLPVWLDWFCELFLVQQ